MKTKLIIAILAVVAGSFTVAAQAQMATVRGKVIDNAGKPVAGATVDFSAADTGRKYSFKTNDKGQYSSIGVVPGTYNVNVTNKDGQLIDSAKNFSVSQQNPENVLDFDLAKSTAAAEAKMSADEKAKREAITKENQKIKGLNEMLASAHAASEAGNYDQAVAIMTQATQTDPTRDLLWANLGDAYINAGKHTQDKTQATNDFQQSVAAYKKAVEIKPAEGKYYNNLGEAYARLGQSQDAAHQYELAAQNDPPNAAKYYFNQGAVLTNAGHPDDANAAFDKAINANPEYAEAYYQRAVNSLGKAKVDEKTGTMIAPPEVATDLSKYLELAPTGPNAESAKALLASLGEKVQTSYGKGSTKKKQ